MGRPIYCSRSLLFLSPSSTPPTMMFGPLPFPYSPVYGLYYVVNGAYVPVDLLDVRATAQIKDLAAQVTLSQRYHLPKSTPRATEATYSFPVPSRAAVSSFGLVKEDGSRVVGLVQEKEEARTTYDEAVQSGKLASLMVQDSPDGAFPSRDRLVVTPLTPVL